MWMHVKNVIQKIIGHSMELASVFVHKDFTKVEILVWTVLTNAKYVLMILDAKVVSHLILTFQIYANHVLTNNLILMKRKINVFHVIMH
jgi:hypothetical protein